MGTEFWAKWAEAVVANPQAFSAEAWYEALAFLLSERAPA